MQKYNLDCEYLKERIQEAAEIKKNNPAISGDDAVFQAIETHEKQMSWIEWNMEHNHDEFITKIMQLLDE